MQYRNDGLLSKNGARKTGYLLGKKNEPRLWPNTITKINFNWIPDVKVWAETTRLLEENLGKIFHHLKQRFPKTSKAWAMKEKNIIGLCQIFTFLLFKRRHFKKMKRQAIDRSKNVFQIHIFDTKQVSKIYKEPLQLNRKNNPKKHF